MLQFHLEKIGVGNHQSGITKILGTVPSCPMRPKYPHSPVLGFMSDTLTGASLCLTGGTDINSGILRFSTTSSMYGVES